jgi:hypothetical protein
MLALAAAAAWGQSEEDLTAAAGKEIDAYTGCLRQQVRDMAKSDAEENAIVDKAMNACQAQRSNLLERLQESSLELPLDKAMQDVQNMDDALRLLMLDTIKKARG